MDPNADFNGQQQQQQYTYQQYTQPLQQQPVGTPQVGYTQVAQQTPSGYSLSQQGASQPFNQGLLQQMPMQQPASNVQPQQQLSYQNFQQGSTSAMTTPAPVVGQWVQPQSNTSWQTAANSATTTTTTTTTTKSTKERQASQPGYAASSAVSDFSSLMQQPSVQQPVRQQQQQTINYSQPMQSGSRQQQPQPQPAIDYTQFMQNNASQTSQNTNFSQLMQATPQPQVSQAPPVVHAPRPAQGSNQASNSATATTTSSSTTVVGGTSRQQAATKGDAELRRFDQNVSNRLKRSFGGVCQRGYDFYAVPQGYICGGSNHFFAHGEIEAMLQYGRPPQMQLVNDNPWFPDVAAPPGNGNGSGEEPLFWPSEEQWRYRTELGYMRMQSAMAMMGYNG